MNIRANIMKINFAQNGKLACKGLLSSGFVKLSVKSMEQYFEQSLVIVDLE